jgi:nucleoside recognition membrane protein YjiH
MLEHFLVSVISGISLATVLVEKSEDYPVRYISKPISSFLLKVFGENVAFVMTCTVCLSFWTTLLCELFMYYFLDATFLWPITGLAASGISFYLIDFLNTLDNRKA